MQIQYTKNLIRGKFELGTTFYIELPERVYSCTILEAYLINYIRFSEV